MSPAPPLDPNRCRCRTSAGLRALQKRPFAWTALRMAVARCGTRLQLRQARQAAHESEIVVECSWVHGLRDRMRRLIRSRERLLATLSARASTRAAPSGESLEM